jgi:hypothetical protein
LIFDNQRNNDAVKTRSPGSTRTVGVVRCVGRRVKVDHAWKGFEVNSPSGNVSGNECNCSTAFKLLQGPLSLILRAVAMNRH